MPIRRNDLPALGMDAVRLLSAGAIAFAAEGLLESNRMLALVVGALAVDWLAGRAGLKWDETGQRTWKQTAGVLARGVAVGAAIALAALVALTAIGKARIALGHPAIVGLALGLVTALVQSARDELLFRGMPLALAKDRIPDRWALPFTALLGAAPLILSSRSTATGIAVTLLSGFAFSLLWRLGRGAYLAWGAHAAWLFFSGTALRGTLLDVRFDGGQLLPIGQAAGAPAWAAMGALAVAIGILILRVRRTPPARAIDLEQANDGLRDSPARGAKPG